MTSTTTIVSRRHVPNDNDCLFATFSYLCEGGAYSPASSRALRAHCATVIAADPDTYSELMLGRPNAEYCTWIQNTFNWGGESEILILARKFGVEASVVSCESFTVMTYNEGGANGRIYFLYTGQHYDPLVGAGDSETRIFAPGTDHAPVEAAAVAFAREAAAEAARKKAQRRKKVLKCAGCGALCDDNAAFQAHCMEVEHGDDFMYMCEEVEVVVDGDAPLPDGCVDLAAPDVHAVHDAPTEPLSNDWLCPEPLRVAGEAGEARQDAEAAHYASVTHLLLCRRFDPAAPATAALRSKIRAAPTAGDAARVADFDAPRELDTRAGWADVPGGGREAATLAGLRAKFGAAGPARDALLATAGKRVVVVSADTWAGVDNSGGLPKGRNHLGRLLGQVRDELTAKK